MPGDLMTYPQLLAEPSDLQLAFFSILCFCPIILAPLSIPSIPNPELKTGNCSSSVVSPLYRFGHDNCGHTIGLQKH